MTALRRAAVSATVVVVLETLAPYARACEPPYPVIAPSYGQTVAPSCAIVIVNNTTWTGIELDQLRVEQVLADGVPGDVRVSIQPVEHARRCLDEGCDATNPVDFDKYIVTPAEPWEVGAIVRVYEGADLVDEFNVADTEAACPDPRVDSPADGQCVYECGAGCGVSGRSVPTLTLPLLLVMCVLQLTSLRRRLARRDLRSPHRSQRVRRRCRLSRRAW